MCVCVFLHIDPSTISNNARDCQSGTWSQRGTEANRSHPRYFQHAHSVPIVGVRKIGAY